MKICVKCDKEKEDDQFRKKRNICLKCYSDYNKEYRLKNGDKIKEVHKAYWKREGSDKRRESVRNSEERTIESFMAVQARSIRFRCKDPKKRAFANYDECDITTEYLMELWNKNDGKCIITGLQMNHKTGNLYTVSVDRIDSGKSYLQGNIQLLCKGVNLLKNKHTQDETLKFFEEYFELMVGSENVLRYIIGSGNSRYAKIVINRRKELEQQDYEGI